LRYVCVCEGRERRGRREEGRGGERKKEKKEKGKGEEEKKEKEEEKREEGSWKAFALVFLG
jgi:hypothetical protein